MPRQTNIDWPTAKALRQEGLSYTKIADRLQCNPQTLRSRAFREKWDESIAKSLEILKQQPISAEERAKRWENDVLSVCEKKLEYLKSIDPKKIGVKELEVASKILRTVDDVGRRSLGLDNEQPKTFHVGLIQEVVEIQLPPGYSPGPVIELGPDEQPGNAD